MNPSGRTAQRGTDVRNGTRGGRPAYSGSDAPRVVSVNGVAQGTVPPQAAAPMMGAYSSAQQSNGVPHLRDAERIESGLRQVIREARLIQHAPLSALRSLPGSNTVGLGMDGPWILQQIVAAIQDQDPLAVFTAVTPIELYNVTGCMCSDLSKVSEQLELGGRELRPVFCFDGIPLSTRLEVSSGPNPTPPNEVATCRASDGNYSAKHVGIESRMHASKRFRILSDVKAFLFRYLRSMYSHVFVGPYSCWAQLAYFMLSNSITGCQYISEMYGSLEMLAFPGVDRVITRIDAVNQVFDFVDRSSVLQAIQHRLGSNESVWTDRDLSSWIILDSLEPSLRLRFLPPNVDTLLFTMTREVEGIMTPELTRGSAVSALFTEHQAQRMQANLAVLDSPVFTSCASCVPLFRLLKLPPFSNLSTVSAYGARLPPRLYVCMFAGLLNPVCAAAVAQGILVDRWPLVDSVDYRRQLLHILTLRVQNVFQLLHSAEQLPTPSYLYQEFARPSTRSGTASSPDEPAPQSCKWINFRQPPVLPLVDWMSTLVHGSASLNSQPQIFFSDVLKQAFLRPTSSPPPRAEYTTIQEVCGAALLHALDALGYFEHYAHGSTEEHLPTPCSRALEEETCNTLSEYTVQLIELLRTSTLHDNPITTSPTAEPPAYPRGLRFASRVMSLVPLNVYGVWSGPFDVEVAAFGEMSRMMSTTLRQLIENITSNLFSTGRTTVRLDQLSELTPKLPFHYPTEFHTGNVIVFILNNPMLTMSDIKCVFAECACLEEDLASVFGFWFHAHSAMKHLVKEANIDERVLQDANHLVVAAARRLQLCQGFL